MWQSSMPIYDDNMILVCMMHVYADTYIHKYWNTYSTCILYTFMQVECICDTGTVSYIHATCVSVNIIHVNNVFLYLCKCVSAPQR